MGLENRMLITNPTKGKIAMFLGIASMSLSPVPLLVRGCGYASDYIHAAQAKPSSKPVEDALAIGAGMLIGGFVLYLIGKIRHSYYN